MARILTKVEEGLLDAYIAMIPKTDGDATPLGQRPLSVLPIVYRNGASVRMLQLEDWFRSWVPDFVFSGGSGRSSVEAWYTTALDIEEVLSGAADSHVHLFVTDVIESFDTVDRSILDKVLSSLGLACLVSPCLILSIMRMFAFDVSLQLGLVSLGLVMEYSLGLPFKYDVHCCFLPLLPWCGYLGAPCGFLLSSVLITPSVCVCVGSLSCCCVLLGLLLGMFDWSVRSLLAVSVSC